MQIGSHLDHDPRRIEEDPMDELDNILEGARPEIPEDIMQKATEQMINEIMTKSQETMELFNKLKYQAAANKGK